ncbi:hypothetical protein [Paraburkholderia aromaticivorans]|uniref:hypothetical protein n=1 Tax=Paraburkholderia aromaticivorans TaxID=2026199 RepID=UPI001455F5A5|nr:hypothetical protein [Paraburkholderia aromaticivorans]
MNVSERVEKYSSNLLTWFDYASGAGSRRSILRTAQRLYENGHILLSGKFSAASFSGSIRVCQQQPNGVSKMQRKHIHIPDSINDRAKACAEKLEMSLAEFIRRAIEASLEKHEAKTV